MLVVTLSAFEALAVATAMPVVEKDLGGLRLYGLVFAGFMVGNLVGTGYAGLEADRREPVRPFTVGIVVFAAGLLIGGLAPTMEVVVLARVVQGSDPGASPRWPTSASRAVTTRRCGRGRSPSFQARG